MLNDTHMHCCFSGDSEADPEDMILAAIQKRTRWTVFYGSL